MGWTRLLAHRVVFTDNEGKPFKDDDLLKEVRSLPGLKKATFSMPPRWLKPIERVVTLYTTVTFAISDPDGHTIEALLAGCSAMFGKEVTVQKWVEKPLLVQCSHCHSLGHNKTSKMCTLITNSVKCYICGAAHKSEDHNQKCPKKHAVAGICDCRHYKCLNFRNPGHHCRDGRCPAREQYQPRPQRKGARQQDKGKEQAEINKQDTTADNAPPTANQGPEDDLYKTPAHLPAGEGSTQEAPFLPSSPAPQPPTHQHVSPQNGADTQTHN